jgi:hypothetical protein
MSCDTVYGNCDPFRGSGKPVDPLYDPVPIQPRGVEGEKPATAPPGPGETAPAPKK